MYPVRLETPRLVLREHEESDWPGVLAYATDPAVMRFQSADVATPEAVRAGLARMRAQQEETPRARYEFAVCRRDTGELIGWLPLLLEAPALHTAEIGWTVARAHWGKGYATEAARAVLAFAFEALELHRVWARHQPENVASARVMEKIGMRHEGRAVASAYVKGQWVDQVYCALLRSEWWQRRRETVAP